MHHNPVLIVGSGPTGLACALALAQNGIPVRIIEKLTQRPQSERATAIMPRTLEMYHFLGVLDDVLKEARLPPRCFSYAQGSKDPTPNFELFPTDVEPTPARPMPSVVFLGQHRQEAIMREHLAQFSCTVEYDLELVDIEQYSDHAVGILRQPSGIRERMETPYIVGADGPQSTLRQRLELDFPIPGVKKLITGEVTVSSGLQHQSWYFWGSPTSILLTLRPLPNPGTFSLICGGPELDMSRIVTSSDTFLSLFRKVTGREDVVFGRVEGLSEYSPHTISAKTWKVGRCFIAGDAAHGHSPVLSHGLNLGIQDAVNLGWKLASVLKRISSPTLLDTYTSERSGTVSKALSNSVDVFRSAFDSKRTYDAGKASRPQGQTALDLFGGDYRGTSHVLDAIHSCGVGKDEGRLQAGDRAPDAPGLSLKGCRENKRLFHLFSVRHHTVLVFTDSRTTAASVIAALPKLRRGMRVVVVSRWFANHIYVEGVDAAVLDKDCYAYGAYVDTTRPLTVAFVRPDGYVGAIMDSVKDVGRYSSLMFTA